MKKTYIAFSLLTAFVSGAAFAQTSNAADNGEIEFVGKITEATCQVSIGGSAVDDKIDFQEMTVQQINNGKAPIKPFSMSFENCMKTAGTAGDEAFTAVDIKFENGATSTEDFAPTGSQASNFKIRLMESNNASAGIKPGVAVPFDLSAAKPTKDFFATVVRDGNKTVGKGTITEKIRYVLSYN